jgi:hypothetical protein
VNHEVTAVKGKLSMLDSILAFSSTRSSQAVK